MVTVPADALDDFELLDDLNALDQKGDATRLPAVLRRLLGTSSGATRWTSARDRTPGACRSRPGAEFVMELMGALNPNS